MSVSARSLNIRMFPTREDGEADWVRRGAKGDRAALEAIVRAHQDRVYRFLLKLSGNRETALDLSQETFVKAFAALDRFRAGSPLAPWLLKIANNLFLDHVRARRPESLDSFYEDAEGLEPGAEDPAIGLVAEEADLGAALARLPVPWRQAVILRHVDDHSYDEIAQILDVPVGTVKTWLFRGRERIKDVLGQGGPR